MLAKDPAPRARVSPGHPAAILRVTADARSRVADHASGIVSQARIIVGNHLRATPEGRVVLRLSGSGPATVTLRSARPITPRWLGSTRPRVVRLGMSQVDLSPDGVTTVTLRLRSDHLALLHRMQSMRATIALQTHDRLLTRRIDLHSPACRLGRDRGRARSSLRGSHRAVR